MGFGRASTYIQSGNVLVDGRPRLTPRAVRSIEHGLADRFGYAARVVVRTLSEFDQIVQEVPHGWDPADRSMRHNVNFLADGADPIRLIDGVTPDPALESVHVGRYAVYWSAPLATITRTMMIKLSAHPLYPEVTVRNLRTTLKLHELARARGGTT
jgi:uncharacterized protein (DUF1697 family)